MASYQGSRQKRGGYLLKSHLKVVDRTNLWWGESPYHIMQNIEVTRLLQRKNEGWSSFLVGDVRSSGRCLVKMVSTELITKKGTGSHWGLSNATGTWSHIEDSDIQHWGHVHVKLFEKSPMDNIPNWRHLRDSSVDSVNFHCAGQFRPWYNNVVIGERYQFMFGHLRSHVQCKLLMVLCVHI